jgi:hypothetical protein
MAVGNCRMGVFVTVLPDDFGIVRMRMVTILVIVCMYMRQSRMEMRVLMFF